MREVALQTKLDACEAHARRAGAQAMERIAAAEAGRAAEARAAAQSAVVAETLRRELGEPQVRVPQAAEQPTHQQVEQQAEHNAHQARDLSRHVRQQVQERLPPPPQSPDGVQAEETPLEKLESETTSLQVASLESEITPLQVASLSRHVESMEVHIDSLEQQLDRAELHVAGVQLHCCLRSSLLCLLGEALRRWAAGVSLVAEERCLMAAPAIWAARSTITPGEPRSPTTRPPIQPTPTKASSRRAARMLELARVLWLAPLGGGALARSLWRWHHVIACEGCQLVTDEARRIRGERDMAMDRERTLKRGLASLREERTSLVEQLRMAQTKAPRSGPSEAEQQQAKRLVAQATAERDASARQARELRESLQAVQAELDLQTERARTDRRAATHAQHERQALLNTQSELRAEKREAQAVQAAQAQAQERWKSQKLALERRLRAAAGEGADGSRQETAPALEEARAAATRLNEELAAERERRVAAEQGAAQAVKAAQGASVAVAELARLRGCERDAASLTKQAASASRELREERAAHQQVVARLKNERRAAAAARQDKEAERLRAEAALHEVEAARKREETSRATAAGLRRELDELRASYAAARERHSQEAAKGASHDDTKRRAEQARDVALEEVVALQSELEALGL